MVRCLQILVGAIVAGSVSLSAVPAFAKKPGSAKKSASCADGFQTLASARANLENRIASNLANPPTTPIRILKPEEVRVAPMANGAAFDFKYTDDFQYVLYQRPKKSVGNEIKFLNSHGKEHIIQIVGSSLKSAHVNQVTDMVMQLPANTLESIERVEVQTFVKNAPMAGYAKPQKFILHEDGLALSTVRHEFGHNLAERVWGRMYPYREWEAAFKKDGANYVSRYAKDSASSTMFSEDFADAVQMYLSNVDQFRNRFPNRAALLDSVFRDEAPFAPGGNWQQVSEHYQTRLSRVSRWAVDRPGEAAVRVGGSAILTGAAGYGLIYYVGKCAEGTCPKLQPIPQENPN